MQAPDTEQRQLMKGTSDMQYTVKRSNYKAAQ